jgi:integrase
MEACAMGSIRAGSDNGQLFVDFRYLGKRCREQTALADSPANRKKLEKLLERIEAEIKLGTFDYAKTFPGSRAVAKVGVPFAPALGTVAAPAGLVAEQSPTATPTLPALPPFREFAAIWVSENEVSWRRSHRRTIADILNTHLLPAFGDKGVGHITKSEIMAFRSTLAKVPGRKAETLSAKRINAIMAPLRQVLNEAADRFEFTTPYRNIKALKVLKSDIEPFTFDEVKTILESVRADYKDYYTVRFFTGMRTGEIDGLKWKYVDFERRQILVRETIVLGEEDTTKTDGSQREIQMNEAVYQSLRNQQKASGKLSDYAFCTREGKPLDHNNVTKRVWYPLLRYLKLTQRRPYQTRHTAATLWLAAGENPLWIARQLGHTSTEMLFKVYGRYVPNLTRQDGSAFERLLLQTGTVQSITPSLPAANDPNSTSAPQEPCHG